MRPNSANVSWQLALIRFLYLCTYTMMALVIVYIPLYFDSLGFNKLQIGTIYAIGPFLTIATNLLAGILSDKTKSLRLVLSLLYAGQILALALLVPTHEFGIIAGVMMLFYLFQTPVNSILDSMGLLAADQMKKSFVSIRTFGSAGFAASALLFGLLIKIYGSELTLYLALGTVILLFIGSLFVADFQASTRKFEFRGLWAILRRKRTLGFFFLIMLVAVPHRINDGFFAVAIREAGASETLVGASWLISACSEIPIFFLLAKFGHRFREISLLAIASLMYAVRMLLLSVVSVPWGLALIQAMHSISFGIFYFTVLRSLQLMLPDEYRTSGQAVFAVAWGGMSGIIAGTAGGWLYDTFGGANLFLFGAGFAMLGFAGFMFYAIRRIAP